MPLRAVTFDAAGTLFAPAEPVGRTYARCAADHGFLVRPAVVERRFRAAFAAAPPLAFPGSRGARLAARERAWWEAVVRHALGERAAAACIAELFAYYGRAEAWRVYGDAPAALRDLRARGLRLAVVSNFDGRLPALLAALGLAPLLDVALYSTGVGVAKPAPAIFRHALAALAVRPGEAVHVGDGPGADVAGARAAGMRAVLVDRTCRRPAVPAGVRVVTTLASLARVLDRVTAAQP